MINKTALTRIVKTAASEAGFDFCGVAKAEFLEKEAPLLEEWLNRGFHGMMFYMEKNFDKRLDPRLLVPNAKSVVVLGYNYFPKQDLSKEGEFSISKYAYGDDYHIVIKEKLKKLVENLRLKIGDINGRVFVDSAPVMERAWAQRSGVGWIGKNTLLLNKGMGSFFFLAELIIDLELEYDSPTKDYCGTCTACIDACPTDAIPIPYVVDASKCISYFTIELKEELPQEMKGKFENWIFGCDICQDVCPWNRFAKPHREPRFEASEDLKNLSRQGWIEMTEEVFFKIFQKSALQRSDYSGIKKNINYLISE